MSGLSRGDAEFVDIIHSNPGALGKRDPIGDADFYPNGYNYCFFLINIFFIFILLCRSLDPLPPGCFTIVCAHARAYEFYAESVYPGNENSFMGVKCGSLNALNLGYCPGKKFPMGFAVPKNLKGNYFLKTKANSPFGNESKSKVQLVCKK